MRFIGILEYEQGGRSVRENAAEEQFAPRSERVRSHPDSSVPVRSEQPQHSSHGSRHGRRPSTDGLISRIPLEDHRPPTRLHQSRPADKLRATVPPATRRSVLRVVREGEGGAR